MTSDLSPGTLRRSVFVDSSAIAALINRSDDRHDEAQAVLRWTQSQGRRLVTSNFIIAESHALILSRAGIAVATTFLRRMDKSEFRVLRAEGEDEHSARAIIYRFQDKSFSLVDAISFAMMEARGITVAFTFDSDFAQYGFTTATPVN